MEVEDKKEQCLTMDFEDGARLSKVLGEFFRFLGIIFKHNLCFVSLSAAHKTSISAETKSG